MAWRNLSLKKIKIFVAVLLNGNWMVVPSLVKGQAFPISLHLTGVNCIFFTDEDYSPVRAAAANGKCCLVLVNVWGEIRYNEKWALCSLWNKMQLGKRLHTHLSVRIVFPSLFTAAESYCAVSLPHGDTVKIHSICSGFLSHWNCILIVMVHNSYII